jgi:arylsulfatase A-like enzyme
VRTRGVDGSARKAWLNRQRIRPLAGVSFLALSLILPTWAEEVTRFADATVVDYSPVKGPVGGWVTITGHGFASASSVRFNGVPAPFNANSDSQITARVPSGATSGTISVDTTQADVPFTVQPNIVLILTDDQRWDEMSMPFVQSELVRKGVSFTNAFVVNALCCPSRTTILTGKYSHGTDVYGNKPPHGGFTTFTDGLEDESTIATWLDAAGYRTGLVGKYLNGYSTKRAAYVPPGWDVWNAFALAGNGGYYNYNMSIGGSVVHYGSNEEDYSTDVLADYATDFIDSTSSQQPFFLYFAPRAPHAPSTPPSRYLHAFPNLPPLRPPSYNENDVSDKPMYVQNRPQMSAEVMANQDAYRRRQYQSLRGVDDAVGRLMTELADTGRLADTLVVYASDNGLLFGEHRILNKQVPYEESIRVPMVIRYDPLTQKVASSDPRFVLNLDLAPTFAGAAGLAAPGAEGTSLLPLLAGADPPWRTDFLVEHILASNIPTYCAVRNQGFIYVKYQTGEEELYNLALDPYQRRNVSSRPRYVSRKSAMHSRLVQLCSPPPPGYTPQTPMHAS